MKIKYRSPLGNGVLSLHDASTIENLCLQILAQTGCENFQVRYGWPPKDLDLSAKDTTLASLKMNGESIIIVPSDEHMAALAAATAAESAPQPQANLDPKPEPESTAPPIIPWQPTGERDSGYLVLRVMPDDNSCLFTAFGGAMQIDNPSATLRQKVASYIRTHPEKYDEVVLEMPVEKYCDTITHPDRWGGAIEMSIFSEVFDIQICSIDVKTLRIDRFGENKSSRCILVYSGIHYDRIGFTLDENLPVEMDVTVWPSTNDEVLEKAVQLCHKLQEKNYYTDTTTFVLKCDTPGCNWIGSGEKDAMKHIKESGHMHMSELQIT